jgi:hypothetical protein
LLFFYIGEISVGVIQHWRFVHYQTSNKENNLIIELMVLFSLRYFNSPALCVKCILDGVPSNEKLSDEQSKAIHNILG